MTPTISEARALVREGGLSALAAGAARSLRNRYRRRVRACRPALNRLYRVTDSYGLTDPETVYADEYYAKRAREPFRSDAREIGRAVTAAFAPGSVIDFGCAIGQHLEYFRERGVPVYGVEGHAAAFEHAVIPRSCLEQVDLRGPYTPPTRFELALSIELAEHLAPRYADTLVDSITAAAPVVVFTAAPPGQGGTHHVNEQPRSYWIGKFDERGYAYDADAAAALRDSLDLEKTTHVAENLFVFRERA